MVRNIKRIIAPLYYFVKNRVNFIKVRLFSKPITDIKQIPIIINNFNQYDYLIILIEGLQRRGYTNIHILDNASTYPPLLDYYRDCPYTVYKLKTNYGYLGLWKSGIYKLFENQYFVYTDPDLRIIDECPDDFLEHFYDLLQKYPGSTKVGFSLRISDLPDYFEKKVDVQKWESKFWQKQVEPNVYKAQIDTTFALYRPFTKGGAALYDSHLRVGEPYTMQHLPWYIDKAKLSDNMKYYLSSCSKSTHWSVQIKEIK